MARPKNVIVAQSGGPTPVINNSLRGVIEACNEMPETFGTVYAGWHGIEGVLKEELLDLSAQSADEIGLLRTTPTAGSIGTCRYKLRAEQARDFERIMQVFALYRHLYQARKGFFQRLNECRCDFAGQLAGRCEVFDHFAGFGLQQVEFLLGCGIGQVIQQRLGPPGNEVVQLIVHRGKQLVRRLCDFLFGRAESAVRADGLRLDFPFRDGETGA